MRPETQLQRSIRQYLAVKGFASVHVPNGATLSGDSLARAKQMASLKRDGFTPGFPDLLVYASRGRVGHIEVKCEGSYQTATQRAVAGWLAALGHEYAVCRSLADVDETLSKWGWV